MLYSCTHMAAEGVKGINPIALADSSLQVYVPGRLETGIWCGSRPNDRRSRSRCRRRSTASDSYDGRTTASRTGNSSDPNRYAELHDVNAQQNVSDELRQQFNELDWIVQCFTSPSTQYRLYGRGFLQVKRPNQQYQSKY